MRILLLTLGSFGDINPLVGLGLALEKRGHEAMVIANADSEAPVRQAGLAFTAVSPASAYRDGVDERHARDPEKAPALFFGYCLAIIPEVFSSIKQLYQPGRTIMAATPQVFAARIAQETLGIPLATLVPNPILFPSVYDAAEPKSTRLESALGRWLRRMRFYRLVLKSDRLFAPGINSFRTNLGLNPVRRVWSRWRNSPQRAIGLWPEWFYSPKADWPAQAVVTGFIEYDGTPTTTAADAWEPAIAGGGRAPIVFTSGTAPLDGSDFFPAACKACEILNWPGVLLTEQEKQLRNPLPRMVRHVRYAPLAELLPPAAAIVHHGGIGTAARALKAGIPQLVRPTGFDQYNNASHLARLGVAKSIARREFTPDNVATRLRELLESQTVRERCCHYATKFEHSTALESTCDYIEALM